MRRYRIISNLIIILIVFSNISVFADINSSDYILGKANGTIAGLNEGETVGKADATNKSNTKSAELFKRTIEWEQKLVTLNKGQEYIDGFKEGFKLGFDQGYTTGYNSVSNEEDMEIISIYGAKDFGTTMGRIDGYIAYNSSKSNDWERFVPSDRKLVDMFELNKESWEYRDRFIEIFRDAYKLSFEAAFQVAKLGEKNFSYEQGLKDGDEFAKDLATINAKKDYLLGLSNNYERNMPSQREIIQMFNLNNESKEYQDAFLAGFEFGQSTTGGKIQGGYILYYNNAYREANKEAIETPDTNGELGGREIGKMKGEYAAIIDITLGISNSWTRHKVVDRIISDEYGLQFQSDNYRNAFISGYWNEFMKSYNETFKRLQQDTNKIKTHTEIISIDGKENIGIPYDDKFLVDIDPGTYFNDVVATLDNIPTSYINSNSERHTAVSGVYSLKILNKAGTFDNNKNITIKFKSYGKDVKFGIYKYHYNKWVYIPSVQKGDYLTADINSNDINLYGNIYAVRRDNELPIFHESRGHWAKDEINTYVKREIIYGYPDKTFKPDREISRGEFVTMLSRLYDWYPPYDSNNITRFKDFKEFGYAEKAISYATYYKIVNGYNDGTFKPHNPITYKEVEIIMSRVLNDTSFKWDYFANKMLYDKKIRCSSKDSMNNKITRAEFTFLLHQLNEYQY